MERREFLQGVATGALGLAQGSGARIALRFAHLTDVHIDAKKPRSPAGLARALRVVESLDPQPAFILNGGDAIYDALARDREDTAGQWRLWHDVTRAETSLPFVHCIGNHDIWGWQLAGDPGIAARADYGKAWALAELELERPYHAALHAGWKLIVLDSTQPHPAGYIGRLDEPQHEWLAHELHATPADIPVIIVSHIPILSAAAYLWFGAEPTDLQKAIIQRVLVHNDVMRIKDRLAAHPNVKLCLSGHLHMQERIDYLGVTYACSGAVCGNWWNETTPAFQEFGPAIAVVDCHDDGSVTHALIDVA